jgi:poly(beta-D-mannuronate) lyase
VTLQRAANGLQYPVDTITAGAPRDLAPIAREQVGVGWYPKALTRTALDSGAMRKVAPGEDTLARAMASSAPGDQLQLQRGQYRIDQVVNVDHPVSVIGPRRGRASLQFSRPTLFEIRAGGSLKLARLDIDGALAPDAAGNAVVRIAPGSQAFNYTLLIEDSHIHGLTSNKAFDVVNAGKGSLAARIGMTNTTVEDISGSVIAAAAETDDLGTYNAEQVDIVASRFRNIAGPLLNLYRGGTDESTFGPTLRVHANQLDNVGVAADTSLRLHGVQTATLTDNQFLRSGRVRFSHRVGEPRLAAHGNVLDATAAMQSDTPAETLP